MSDYAEHFLRKIAAKCLNLKYKRPLHEPATYSRHQSQTQLKTGIGVRR